MTIKENVTVYTCEFCKKKKLYVKQAMERHEKWCTYNPATFSACSDCRFIREVPVDFYDKYYETERQTKGFHCNKLDKDLYPIKAEKKGLIAKYPEQFKDKEPMPKVGNCPHQVSTMADFSDYTF